MSTTTDHARALGVLGASKGGTARALLLDSEERRDSARRAAEARWGNVLPVATHSGVLVIGEHPITCFVLENRRRVLSQETFLKAIGRAGKAKGGQGSTMMPDGLPPFLAAENLQPFISDELRQAATPIAFRTANGLRAFGYDALLLPQICEVYLLAKDQGKIRSGQEHIVRTCNRLMRGFARVGIIALVDDATGYQEERARDELHRILEKYISPELMPWTKMFPDEFFRHLYRLHGWEYRPGSDKRTPHVGNLINKYVYGELPPGVLPELRRRNPVTATGHRRYKHHQFLTADTGNPHLDKQISTVLILMSISDSKDEFERNFAKLFGRVSQPRLPLVIPADDEEPRAKRPALPAPAIP